MHQRRRRRASCAHPTRAGAFADACMPTSQRIAPRRAVRQLVRQTAPPFKFCAMLARPRRLRMDRPPSDSVRALARALVVALALAAACIPARAAEPLQLEAKIPLGKVEGRIDHMAIDLARRRLFVAELGNDSVGVVDLDARKVVQRVSRLRTPQGVGYLPSL